MPASRADTASERSPAVPGSAMAAAKNKPPIPGSLGMLYDSTLCVGCQACVAECQRLNGNPANPEGAQTWSTNDKLTPYTNNIIQVWKSGTGEHKDQLVDGYAYIKKQCMHCVDPNCVSVCPVQALRKDPKTGIVHYNPDVCTGCRYCMVGCPFDVPKYDYDNPLGAIHKCELCNQKGLERIDQGKLPGCVEVCPTGAVIFGTREELMAELGLRDRIWLATKLAADDRAAGEAQFADSLRRLRTDRVELLAVHNLRDWQVQLGLARELKAAGKTKYIGLTHFRDDAHPRLAEIMAAEKPDFIQVNYSVSATNADRALLPLARDLGVAVMVNRAFDDGALFARVAGKPLPGWAAEMGVGSWSQMFLKFVTSHPAVTVVIPATGKPDRQSDQLKAGIGPDLTPAQRVELAAMFA